MDSSDNDNNNKNNIVKMVIDNALEGAANAERSEPAVWTVYLKHSDPIKAYGFPIVASVFLLVDEEGNVIFMCNMSEVAYCIRKDKIVIDQQTKTQPT